ncbi:D-alanyl-D-alanine carboxypeptidase [Thermocatellispora tengchongensis]|uniref:D-alanyl-D-alanine carboxypeptidase n=1 Tax=Thermocatellispora tengchongensis TaxID=1073253 RepID=A0A840NXL9_9ACTN|nr:serine hydrolase domain-containing protein [Thermocatellispora tengchongensis]MBB5131529.1 D-alanyl-D-alanine carboxypeptidase [Thermocatellispora tengchongensis]
MRTEKTRNVIGLACVLLVLGAPMPAAADAGRPVPGDVQRALTALAANPAVVGAIGEVYYDGKPVGKGSAGSRLLGGQGGKIPSGARFRIGSQTKAMTATVVLQLVKENRLALDDKLSDLLPELARQDLVELADEITLHHLIKHTSGIPDYFQPHLLDFFDFTTRYSPIDLVKVSRGQSRQQKPGERFAYSNTNYVLLGMIIERLTGDTLAAEFDRRLFKPLKMSRTYLPTQPGQGIKGPHGHGYYPDADGRLRDMDRFNPGYSFAAGGVISTARDISTFHQAFRQDKLLPPELRKVLTDPPPGAPAPPPPAERLCGGDPVISQSSGGAPGYNATTFSSPDGRLQFALSTTLAVPNTDPAVTSLVEQAAEAVLCPAE